MNFQLTQQFLLFSKLIKFYYLIRNHKLAKISNLTQNPLNFEFKNHCSITSLKLSNFSFPCLILLASKLDPPFFWKVYFFVHSRTNYDLKSLIFWELLFTKFWKHDQTLVQSLFKKQALILFQSSWCQKISKKFWVYMLLQCDFFQKRLWEHSFVIQKSKVTRCHVEQHNINLES